MNIEEIQKEVIEDFSYFDDWMQKYEQIIEMGKGLSGLDQKFCIDENRVVGCQSNVWLVGNVKDGIFYVEADSDAVITKGLIALVLKILSGHPPEEVVKAKVHAIDGIGLKEHLSPNRSNGLMSMIETIKELAAKEI